MELVITASYEQNGKNFNVKATDQVETQNDPKIQMMKSVIEDIVPEGQPFQIQVRCLPEKQVSSESCSAQSVQEKGAFANPNKTWKKKTGNQQKQSYPITERQLKYLCDTLRKLQIPETQICQEYNVDRIENLAGRDAQKLIGELLQSLQSQS